MAVARTRRRQRSRSEEIPVGHRPEEVPTERRADPQAPDLWARGDRRSGPDTGVLHVVTWSGGKLVEAEGTEALRSAHDRKPATTCWIDLRTPNPEQVAAVTEGLGLHPLIAEDILEGNQRPKIEVTDDLVHIVMFALPSETMEPTEIDFVLGKGFLLTVHGVYWEPRAAGGLRMGLEPILARGPDHLLWALVDDVVDAYFPFIDRMGETIEDIEDRIIVNPDMETLERLFDLKRELLRVRRAATPVREIFNQLTNRDLALIDDEEILYFRDVYDHLIRLTDELDSHRELLSGTLEVYLSTVNNNLSLIMKRLTGVTVVLTGIAAIGGIFGMSEAGTALAGKEAIGFWLVTVFTIGFAFLMAWVLRRIGWI
jgi:magnesium transporter